MKYVSEAITGILITSLFLAACAKVGAPTGGVRDSEPPRYVGGEPENRSTHFSGKEINFWFDEYIQLKDLNKELMISPPLEEKPDVRIREKGIRIELNNELLPATTYTINFGNAISDLNESNLFPDFEFVFSTGDIIDTLAVTGKTLNAFDQKPLKDESFLIMLYEDLSDSAPLVKQPRYIGRANQYGLFSVNNIHPDTCRIIALNDANGNLKYDPGSEYIAFLDSFLVIDPATVKPLTFIRDTVRIIKTEKRTGRSGNQAKVKPKTDTTILEGKKLNALNVSLYYFLEETDEIYLDGKKRESAEKLFFSFSRPPHDSVRIRPLNYNPVSPWFVPEVSMKGDTLVYWITDSTMARKDTLLMAVSFTAVDSSGNFILRTDTVNMRYQKPEEKSTGGRRTRTSIVKDVGSAMKLAASISNRGTQNLNKTLIFTADKPIAGINPDSIELIAVVDSLNVRKDFTCTLDSTAVRKFRLGSEWNENTPYRLLLKPNAVRDIYGHMNDSVEIRFMTQKAGYYGRLIVSAGGSHYPLIIQVFSQKGNLVDIRVIKQPERIVFDYLTPDKYTLKAIFDANGSGGWDTGNYLKKRQPEQVFYYKLPIELRSNWDLEVNWEIID